MDNKITKKRLSDMFSYDWIIILVVALVAILLWELVYTMTATRITVGQQFKIYFDQNVSLSTSENIYDKLEYKANENGKTFSYEIMELSEESLDENYNVLSVRLSIYEGDVIFTDCTEDANGKKRVDTLIDSFSVYSLDDLYSDATEYLDKYLTNGEIDEGKVKLLFEERTKGDKRFKSEEEKSHGVLLEKERISKLKKDVEDFKKLLDSDNQDLFYNYKKYFQMSKDDSDYKELYDAQSEKRYGINMGALSNSSKFMKIKGTDSAENIVLNVFDFKERQPDFQYEAISFINVVCRECGYVFDD